MVAEPSYDDRLAEIRKWQDEMLEEHGFYTHFTSDEDYPYGLNAHTHGLPENFGHRDLQIVLSMPPPSINHVLHSVVNRIKEGRTYEPNKIYRDIIDGNETLNVLFVLAEECEREVLRLIFPGPDLILPPTEEYTKQLEGAIYDELPTT